MFSFGGSAEEKPLCQCPANQNKEKNGDALDAGDAPCRKVALDNSLFCKEHQNCKPAPTNGSEPKYIPEILNKSPKYVETHNCISYALRGNKINRELMAQCKDVSSCSVNFEQPGAASGQRGAMRKGSLRTCPTVAKLTKSDLGSKFVRSSYSKPCQQGMSKVALVVAPGTDYHWYRQNPDGTWSDKAGSNKVKNWDAKKRKVFNPSGASRDYGDGLAYKDFCGFFCVDRTEPVPLKQGGKRKSRKVLKGGKRITRKHKHSRRKSRLSGVD
jgi:hypothetical protein